MSVKLIAELTELFHLTPFRKRPHTGGVKRMVTAIKTRHLSFRVPLDLVRELENLNGVKSRHIERAIALYLRLVKLSKQAR